MSQNRVSKKLPSCKSGLVTTKYQTNDIHSILTAMLNPILQKIALLNETVSSVVTLLNKKDNETDKKLNKNCEFASSSISTDVTMMASSIHRLTKNYESLKEQIVDNQKNLDKFWAKLNNIEKLLVTFLKMENTRSMKNKEEQIFEKVSNLEQALLGSTEEKQINDGMHCSKQYQVSASVGLDSSLQLITLNNEEDYPTGSWLGDVNSAKCRVRCPISEEDVIYINTRCSTPEKMAITLLDYIFPRETLAVSNLSGKSKLGKKQLDPLMIYGIKCHLMHHFNISEKQWERIKQNMDSKCRSAWKKRKLNEPKDNMENEDMQPKQFREEQKTIETIEQLMVGGLKTQVIHTLQGDIEVLHATPDQILRFQDVHNIHVLDGDHILPVINSDPDDSDGAITSELGGNDDCEENLTIITTDDNDLHGDEVNFVTEPMLEVLTEDTLNMDSSVLIKEE